GSPASAITPMRMPMQASTQARPFRAEGMQVASVDAPARVRVRNPVDCLLNDSVGVRHVVATPFGSLVGIRVTIAGGVRGGTGKITGIKYNRCGPAARSHRTMRRCISYNIRRATLRWKTLPRLRPPQLLGAPAGAWIDRDVVKRLKRCLSS